MHREGHVTEKTAGVFIVIRRDALFIRHGVFRGADKKLCGALNPDNREHTDADNQPVAGFGSGGR